MKIISSYYNRTWFIIIIIISSAFSAVAQRYWVSTTGGTWSNPANWSTISGGIGGAGAPVGTPAIFDGMGGAIGNCTIDVNVSVSSFEVDASYIGNIFQGISSLSINGNSIWSGGSFVGGSGTINNNGTLIVSGCNFTSTTSTLNITNNFTLSSGNFNHHNGSVNLNTSNILITGSPAFYNLKCTSASNIITFNNSLSVQNNLHLDAPTGTSLIIETAPSVTVSVFGTTYLSGTGYIQVNTGTIAVHGDLLISNTNSFGGGSGTFYMTGTSNQLFSNTGIIGQGRLPSVIIDKPLAGILTLSGNITVIGPYWSYITGIINPGTSLINFTKQSGGSNISISGTHSLYDAIISSSYASTTINDHLTLNRNLTIDGTSSSNEVIINSTVTVNGTLNVNGSNYVNINNGLLDSKGDIINTNNAWAASGTGTVSITGSGNQLWACSGAVDGQGTFPNILINKPSGTLSLSGLINTLGPNWTYSAGIIAPGTSTLCIYDNGGRPIVMSGNHTLNDLIIYPFNSVNVINNHLTVRNLVIDGSYSHDLNITNTVTINGNLVISGSSPVRLNTGIIYSNGDIRTTNTSLSSGGTATLVFSGSINQNLTGTGVANQSRLPNAIIINKPLGGGVYISGGVPFHFYGSVFFNIGIMYSTSSQLAYFYSGSTAVGANGNSFVSGPIRKRGNTAFIFPTGKANLYAPVGISAPSNVTNVYTAEYFNQNPNPTYNVNSKDVVLNNVSNCEYWMLNRNSGTSNVHVTLSWDTRSCGVGNMSDLRIARWDGALWRNQGNGMTSGNLSMGTITTGSIVNSFVGPLTLSSVSGLNNLPIELLQFESECSNDAIKLTWSTASEINNNYFEVERSLNGINWQAIGQIEAAENSIVNSFYSYNDFMVTGNHTYYYRLKQVDFNQSYTYSPIISSENCSVFENENLNIIYLSEFGNYIVSGFSDVAKIEIFNAQGNKVKEFNTYKNNTLIDLSNFASGIYLLNYTSNNIIRVKKIVQ